MAININPVVGHVWGSYSTADGFISLGNDLAGLGGCAVGCLADLKSKGRDKKAMIATGTIGAQ